MGKNILVLTGSPRIGGNSDMLADAFIKRAQENGHTLNKVRTAALTINGCRACDACWTSGSACVQRDGMVEIEPLLETADVLVLVSPLYFFGMSAQLKIVIDRLYAYCIESCLRPLRIKECALLMCGETDAKQSFSGAVETYKNIADYMHWQNKGILLVPNVLNKGDIEKSSGLAEVQSISMSIEC